MVIVCKIRDRETGLFKQKRMGSGGWSEIGCLYKESIAKGLLKRLKREQPNRNLEIVRFQLIEVKDG
jgi:hypothetical protein